MCRRGPRPRAARASRSRRRAHDAGVAGARLRAMAQRTRALFEAGRPVCDGVSGRLRWELRVTWLGGMRILDRLERPVRRLQPPADARLRLTSAGALLVDAVLRGADAQSTVARDTNFYYSFLVLPPDKRRAIVAVWDFCRAVDDAVDEAGGDGRATPRSRRSRAGGDELAAVLRGRHARRRRRAARSRRSSRSSICPAQAFEALIEGVEMDLGHAATRRSRICTSTASASRRPSA